MPSFYELMGVPRSGFDPDRRFVTSWLLPPILLASMRGLFAVYCFVTIFTVWGWDGSHKESDLIGQSFSYFTNLTYWGLAFYLLFASIHTFTYTATGRTWLEAWPRILQVLHSLLYTTITDFPLLVTLVYWIVLYEGPWFPVEFDAWSNISRHALNSLFSLLEILLPTTNPPPWLHLVFLIVILLLYLSLAYLTHATQGFYVYNFLNPARGQGKVAAYCCGIAAAIIVIFLVVWGLVWIRRKFTGSGKRSRKDTSYHSTEEISDVEMAFTPNK